MIRCDKHDRNRTLFYAVCIAVMGLAFLTASKAAGQAFGEAQWLRDPLFAGVETITYPNTEQTAPAGPRNVHTYFRHEFMLDKKPASAILRFSADDYCILYINGQYAVQGPEPGYPFAYPYYEIDVTSYLQAGGIALPAMSIIKACVTGSGTVRITGRVLWRCSLSPSKTEAHWIYQRTPHGAACARKLFPREIP